MVREGDPVEARRHDDGDSEPESVCIAGTIQRVHAYPWVEVRQTPARLKWAGCDSGEVSCIVADQQLLRGAYVAKEQAALQHQAPLSPPLTQSVRGPQ
jgi:hypothetical protein